MRAPPTERPMWSRAYASPDRPSIFVVAYRSASWSFHALPHAQKRCLCGTSIGRASRLWVNMGEERYDRSLAVNPSDYVRHHTFAFRCTFSEHCSHGDRLTVVNDSMGAVGSVPASDTSLGRFVVEAPWAPASMRRPAAARATSRAPRIQVCTRILARTVRSTSSAGIEDLPTEWVHAWLGHYRKIGVSSFLLYSYAASRGRQPSSWASWSHAADIALIPVPSGLPPAHEQHQHLTKLDCWARTMADGRYTWTLHVDVDEFVLAPPWLWSTAAAGLRRLHLPRGGAVPGLSFPVVLSTDLDCGAPTPAAAAAGAFDGSRPCTMSQARYGRSRKYASLDAGVPLHIHALHGPNECKLMSVRGQQAYVIHARGMGRNLSPTAPLLAFSLDCIGRLANLSLRPQTAPPGLHVRQAQLCTVADMWNNRTSGCPSSHFEYPS